MKISAIKELIGTYDLNDLRRAEEAILNEQKPAIPIAGDDEGEQLTHVIAAIEVAGHIQKGMKESEALRTFTQRVRRSIS